MDMKFSKAVVLPLLLMVTLGVTGFAYAWWTETLQIDGSVNTGELTVKMGNFGGAYWQHIWWADVSSHITYAYEILDGGYTVKMTLGNYYPGASVRFNVPIKNVGTIPAKIDSVVLNVTSDPGGLKDYIYTRSWVRQWDKDGNQIWNSGWPPFVPLEQLDEQIYVQLLGRVLKPGEIFFFGSEPGSENEGCLYFRLETTAPDTTENKTITFTLTFTFKQWNAL
jgi:hypothetical protein